MSSTTTQASVAQQPRVLGVIPARLASTRLPRKVLREIAGRPLLAWVVEAARRCPQLDEVVVAADSQEVQQLCAARRWRCVMTSPELPSGTDRLFAVSREIPAGIYVNIQADEPLLEPAHIAALLAPFLKPRPQTQEPDIRSLDREPWTLDPELSPGPAATTLKVRCPAESIHDPNVVKVVTAPDGRALYFSRATIPFHRDTRDAREATYWKHLGLYAYRRDALARFAALPPSPLEQTERLEQLRLLESNIPLYVAEAPSDTIGVDTEEDLRHVEMILKQRVL